MTKKGIQIQPIRTEKDHDRALTRIDELMGAKRPEAVNALLDSVAVELDGATPSLAEILRRDRAADDDARRVRLLDRCA